MGGRLSPWSAGRRSRSSMPSSDSSSRCCAAVVRLYFVLLPLLLAAVPCLMSRLALCCLGSG